MTIYHIITIGLFLSAILELTCPLKQKEKKVIFLIWFFVLLLFKGLRWDTGTDWAQYLACFKESSWSNIFSYTRYGSGTQLMEFGYVFLNILIKTITGHYTFFLLITNAFILYAHYKIFKLFLPNFYLVALAMAFVTTDLFPVRQNISIAIFYLALRYIVDNKFKQYCICCVLCFTIHRSSLLILLLYPLLRLNFHFIRSIAIYCILVLGTTLVVNAFDLFHNVALINALTGGIMDQYDAAGHYEYVGQFEETDNYITQASSLIQLTVFAFPYYRFKFSKESDKFLYGIVLNMYFIYIALNIIGRIPGFVMVYRVSNNISISYPLVVTLACYYYLKEKKKLIALMIFMAAFYIKCNNMPPFNSEHEYYELYRPYKTFLQEDERPRDGVWPYHQKQ